MGALGRNRESRAQVPRPRDRRQASRGGDTSWWIAIASRQRAVLAMETRAQSGARNS
jgi:hypothetical protein